LEKSRKWIIREGRTGISRAGSGASMAMRLEERLVGLRIRPRRTRSWLATISASVARRSCSRSSHVKRSGSHPARTVARVPAAVAAHRGAGPVGVQASRVDEDAFVGATLRSGVRVRPSSSSVPLKDWLGQPRAAEAGEEARSRRAARGYPLFGSVVVASSAADCFVAPGRLLVRLLR